LERKSSNIGGGGGGKGKKSGDIKKKEGGPVEGKCVFGKGDGIEGRGATQYSNICDNFIF